MARAFIVYIFMLCITILFILCPLRSESRIAVYPTYAKPYIKDFNQCSNIMLQISYVESRHTRNTNHNSSARGRFGIKPSMLDYWCQLNKKKYETIECPKSTLDNDIVQWYLICWFFDFYRKYNFDIENIVQIWRWGLYNVYVNDKWDYYYQFAVLGHRREKKLNTEQFDYICGKR